MDTKHPNTNEAAATERSPAFPLSIIEEEQMIPALDSAIRKLLCACFPADAAVFSKTRAWHGSAPAYSVVHQPDGEALGQVGVVVRTVLAGSTPAKVAGIQNFAVRPDCRRTGLGPALMSSAMTEAKRRGIRHGLLFCVPALEKYYSALGWSTIPAPAVMLDDQGRWAPIPGKNISMVRILSDVPFPPGVINLQGADW